MNTSINMNVSSTILVEPNYCGHNETHTTVQQIVRVHVMLPLIVLGLCGNMVNLLVFTRASMRKQQVNWFLSGLAVCDCLVLCSTFTMLTLPILAEWSKSIDMHTVSAVLTRHIYPFALTSQTCGVYMTVVVSVHRYLGVCYPFRMRRWGTGTNVKRVIVAVIIWAILFNVPKWFELTLNTCLSELVTDSGSTTSYYIIQDRLAQNVNYSIWYMVVAYLFVMFAFPFTVLIVVNILIITQLKNSKMALGGRTDRSATMGIASAGVAGSLGTAGPEVEKLNKKKPKQLATEAERSTTMGIATAGLGASLGTAGAAVDKVHHKERKDISTTLMLIAVVALFLVCNILAFIVNVIEMMIKNGTLPTSFFPLYSLLCETSNCLVNLSSSANIVIYYIFGTRFRQTLQSLLHKWGCWPHDPLISIQRRHRDPSFMPSSAMTKSDCLLRTRPQTKDFTERREMLQESKSAVLSVNLQTQGNSCAEAEQTIEKKENTSDAVNVHVLANGNNANWLRSDCI